MAHRATHLNSIISITIVFSVFPVVSGDDPRVWLEPCSALHTRSVEDLERHKRLTVVLSLDKWPVDRAGHPVATLVVEPAFEPEWVVSIFKPEGQDCSVVAFVADENVYYANDRDRGGEIVLRKRAAPVSSAQYAARISCNLATEVGATWRRMLHRLRVPQTGDPSKYDGVRYTATQYEYEVGVRCGSTHSPPAGSPAAQLAEVGSALLMYAQRSVERDTIEKLVASLDASIDALNGDQP